MPIRSFGEIYRYDIYTVRCSRIPDMNTINTVETPQRGVSTPHQVAYGWIGAIPENQLQCPPALIKRNPHRSRKK